MYKYKSLGVPFSILFPGLILCKLAKGGSSSSRSRATQITTTTESTAILSEAEFFGGGQSLLDLVLNGDLDTARQLIEDGADVNEADVHGNTVLHIAAQVSYSLRHQIYCQNVNL